MTTVAGLLGLYILAILLGKQLRRERLNPYIYVALIALLQTCFVLYLMFTKSIPSA